eukprot:snap_masked-scaffold_2-processed-gene-14.11-mRNA-1 protein AED:1.00 eAED:1.00 QI:0/0/0/0/1/1/2/0/146
MWGYNNKHQLGVDIEEEERSFPVKVDLPLVKEVYCGDSTTFVKTKDRTVMVFGHNENGKLGLESSEEIIEKPTVLESRWGKECNLELYGFDSHTFLLAKNETDTQGYIMVDEDEEDISCPCRKKTKLIQSKSKYLQLQQKVFLQNS